MTSLPCNKYIQSDKCFVVTSVVCTVSQILFEDLLQPLLRKLFFHLIEAILHVQ